VIGTVHSGEQLDEGALARPVLTNDRVNLAGTNLERGGAEGLRGAESLGSVGDSKGDLRVRP
jgi:hypothetical protein